MSQIKGYSIIYHKGKENFKHIGKYVDGLFSDRNKSFSPDEKTGWGFKVDLFMIRIIRPMYYFWKLFNEKELNTPIYTVPQNRFYSVFGADIAKKLIEKKRNLDIPNEQVHDYKYGIWNPWKGKYLFILDSYFKIPCFFISISTPYKSFYIGVKTYDVEADLKPATGSLTDEFFVNKADQGDYTWANGKYPSGRYGALSGSIRSKR